MTLYYNTRDANGNDITKEVQISEPETMALDEQQCCFCGLPITQGVDIKKLVSGSFTDWRDLYSGYSCRFCAVQTKLFKYSFIINGEKIRLFNIREMAKEILEPQEPPFKIVVSTSQKKHLFYKALTNHNPEIFTVNLEEEQIKTSLYELRELFAMVSALQALGNTKSNIKESELNTETHMQFGEPIIKWLEHIFKNRPIQIPLFLSQKNENIKKEDAICCINSILTTFTEHAPR